MIVTAVGAVLCERVIAEGMVIRKLGLGWQHLPLLKNIAKTAAASVIAGALTYVVYAMIHRSLLDLGEHFVEATFSTTKLSTLNFFGGGLVLAICAAVFLPTYLLAANMLGIIEQNEKDTVRKMVRKFIPFRRPAAQQA